MAHHPPPLRGAPAQLEYGCVCEEERERRVASLDPVCCGDALLALRADWVEAKLLPVAKVGADERGVVEHAVLWAHSDSFSGLVVDITTADIAVAGSCVPPLRQRRRDWFKSLRFLGHASSPQVLVAGGGIKGF